MKAQRSNSRNEALLDAAAQLFAEGGFRSTSMRDIAKAVDMLPGSIYYHFPSKEDLLLAIYQAGVEQITATFEAAVEPYDDPWEKLEAGVTALVAAVSENQAYTRVIFTVKPDDVEKYRDELIACRDQFEQKFSALIDQLPLQPWVDKHLLKLMILGAGNHAQLWFSPDGEKSLEEIGEHFARLIRDSIAEDS